LTDDGPTSVQLVLRALPRESGDAPRLIGLRRVLKSLLRAHGWRCVSVLPVADLVGDRPADAILYDLEAIHE
jgi:hypothetical protein